MAMMRAVVVDPEAAGRLSISEVEEPEAAPSEALVRVAAISLNRGEVRRAEASEAGFRPGWDLAGTVERAAADGSGRGWSGSYAGKSTLVLSMRPVPTRS